MRAVIIHQSLMSMTENARHDSENFGWCRFKPTRLHAVDTDEAHIVQHAYLRSLPSFNVSELKSLKSDGMGLCTFNIID